jgi:hypothetical protein
MVRRLMMATARRVKVGDKVLVPMAPFDVIGEVLEVYGPRGHRHARVLVPVLGPNGETLDQYDTGYPLHDLRLADAEAA